MLKRSLIPAETVRAVLVESGHRCAICGVPCPIEMAHIVPWSEVKDNTAENLIALCANCHARADKEHWGERVLRNYKEKPWVAHFTQEEGEVIKSKRRVEFTIELEAQNLNDEKNLELLKYALAAFLDILPKDVRIKSVTEG